MLREHAAPGRQRSGSSPTFSISKKTGHLQQKQITAHMIHKSCSEKSVLNTSDVALTAIFSVDKSKCREFVIRFKSGNLRAMKKKEKQEMTNIKVCRKNENEAMRFWGARKRLLTIPLSEKQILRVMGESYKDA